MELTPKQRRALRGMAHALRPVVQVGQAGVGPGVIAATAQALDDHELVKVRLAGAEGKKAAAAALAAATDAALCGLVGHVAILYRPDRDAPRIVLPPG